jgi:hypothetical protein
MRFALLDLIQDEDEGMPHTKPTAPQPTRVQHTASRADILSRHPVELTRLDARIAELLLCLYSIPRFPDSGLGAKSTSDASIAGFHPL